MTSTATPRLLPRRLGTLVLALTCALALLAQLSSRQALAGVQPEPTASATPAAEQETPVDPAPENFREDLSRLYASQFQIATDLGTLPVAAVPQDDFAATMQRLSETELAEVWATMTLVPRWDQIADLTTASQQSGAARTGPGEGTGGDRPGEATEGQEEEQRTATGPTALEDLQAILPALNAGECKFELVDAEGLLGLSIVVDVLSAAIDVLGQIIEILPESPFNFKDAYEPVIRAIIIILIGVQLAFALAIDQVSFERATAGDCLIVQARDLGNNVDRNVVTVHELLLSLRGQVAAIDQTVVKTLIGVQDLDADLVVATAQILGSLETSLQDVQTSIGGSTGVSVTYLQQLQQIMDDSRLTLGGALEEARAQLLAADGAGSTELQTQVSDSLTRTLAEIGVAHDQLRSRLDARTQSLLDAAELDSDSSRTEALSALRADIEQALASKQARTLYRLPASRGGLLDALPVGVQQVVNDDFRMMNEIGAKIEPSAVKALNDGNAAVSAGQWLAAYGHFEAAYAGMINAR